MSLEKDINSLTKSCEAYLRKDGYSEGRILDYQRLWADGIVSYMKECSISIYTSDIGEQFIRHDSCYMERLLYTFPPT
jgi:hypothetical protein